MDLGIGNLIGSVCDKFLPKELQFLGHVAGGVADFYTGNYAAILKDGLDVCRDLPLDKLFGSGSCTPPRSDGTQPSPPDFGRWLEGVIDQLTGAKKGDDNKTGGSKSDGDKKVDKAKEFFKQSDADFTKAIEDGKIPKEVTESPEALLQLQQRMNHIAEMNALMSNMIKAMHDMRMAIIQNLRV